MHLEDANWDLSVCLIISNRQTEQFTKSFFCRMQCIEYYPKEVKSYLQCLHLMIAFK